MYHGYLLGPGVGSGGPVVMLHVKEGVELVVDGKAIPVSVFEFRHVDAHNMSIQHE
jgi:hypothetical protein